ncbi:MAG: aromatic acid exporter family protein [Rhizonema sp. PD38]|nr:aromatic acid exporter family protein [Rhizonema sp. PD38]
MNSLIKFSLKVAIGGALVAELFRYAHLDQNLIYYPALGYLSMIIPTGGGVLQAGWSRLAGAFLGGIVVALALTCLGDHPMIAALCYVATLLLCEALKWQGFLSATIIFPLMFIDQAHGQYPWHYVYDRIRYNFVGVLIGLIVMAFLWPKKPRETLSNHLTQILRDTDEEFQAIVFAHLRSQRSSAENTQHLKQMQTLVQESQSFLTDLSYGLQGDWFVQDNWSELIAAHERLVRYLFRMRQTLSSEGDNHLWDQYSALLIHLVEQVSVVCTTLIRLIPSRKANDSRFDIPPLSEDITAITEQIQQFRTTQDFMALPTSDIVRFYAFLDALTSFTNELEQLGSLLQTHQILNRKQRRIGLSFRLHSIPSDTVKKHLKAGLALGISAAIGKYFILFDIKQWALLMALMAMSLMEPVWGITIKSAKTITITLALTFSSCYLVMRTLGNSTPVIAITLFALVYLGSAFKLNATFRLSLTTAFALMFLTSPASPTLYVDLWNMFKNDCAGICLALVITRLFWPATTPQKVELSIRQTFTKMGQFYQAIADRYLQGADTSEITSLSQSIQQSIQSQVSLQAFTAHEIVNDAIVAQTHQKWDFFIGYEKKILGNLLSLQDAIYAHNSGDIPHILFPELQEITQLIAQVFKDLGAAEGSELSQQNFSALSKAVNVVSQRLENLRQQGERNQLSLDAIIVFSTVIFQIKEITDNLNQIAQGWSSSPLT